MVSTSDLPCSFCKRFGVFAALSIGSLFLLGLLTGCSSPEEKAAEFVANANVLFTENKLNKAAIEYKNALQINQNLPGAWFGLAKIHERKQEWKQVYATLSKIREMAPNHVDSRIKLGQLLLASNQLDQAMTDAAEILEMAPEDARSHSLMAAVHYRLENFEGALLEVDKALAIDPDHTEALLVRARILIAEKRYDEALAEIDRGIAKHPENVSFYLMKIQAFAQQDKRQAIENVYLALIEKFPENEGFKQALILVVVLDQHLVLRQRHRRDVDGSGREGFAVDVIERNCQAAVGVAAELKMARRVQKGHCVVVDHCSGLHR